MHPEGLSAALQLGEVGDLFELVLASSISNPCGSRVPETGTAATATVAQAGRVLLAIMSRSRGGGSMSSSGYSTTLGGSRSRGGPASSGRYDANR